MNVTALRPTGNSSKFEVIAKGGSFKLALSFTLRRKIWQLADDAAELEAAKTLAEAIVSRHDPKVPFKALYVFAEHNTQSSLAATVALLRSTGYKTDAIN